MSKRSIIGTLVAGFIFGLVLGWSRVADCVYCGPTVCFGQEDCFDGCACVGSGPVPVRGKCIAVVD